MTHAWPRLFGRHSAVAALGLSTLLALTGCGQATPAVTAPTATTASAAAPSAAPATRPPVASSPVSATSPAVSPAAVPSPSAAAKPAAGAGTFTIALSNSYLGNAWRKTMVATFDEAGKAAVADGVIKSYTIQNTAQNTATEQIAQIQSLILQHVNAIAVNAASPTALNPVIQQACDQGIKVVVFDSLASAPCAYTVAHDFTEYGADEARFVVQKLGGKGDLIEVRGVTGSEPDQEIHNGIASVLKDNPGINVVGTVQGEASQTTTAQALQGLIPSLGKIDAVLTQGGGDAQGVIQAFENAGKDVPIVVLGNQGSELRWWQDRSQKSAYTTLSVGTQPGQASVALWMAVDLLNGQQVPQHVNNLPLLQVTQDTLAAYIKATPPDGIATPVYMHQDAEALFSAAKAGQPLPPPPVPAS